MMKLVVLRMLVADLHRPATMPALGQATDGVVLVLEANVTRRVAALSAKDVLEAAGARLLGTVLNNWDPRIPNMRFQQIPSVKIDHSFNDKSKLSGRSGC